MANLHLLRLLQLSDPTLPIGGFAHSAGLETYVQAGIVCDKESARSFISQHLAFNIRYTDAALASLAFDAALAYDMERIGELDGLCQAIKLPREMREASNKLGLRLLKVMQPLLQHPVVDSYNAGIRHKEYTGHYCAAYGICAAAAGIGKADALQAFYYNAAAGMVTNSVKLVPLGQLDGQDLLFSLHASIVQWAGESMTPDERMLGYCCTGFDIRSMQHERLYSRLYMS